MTAKKKTRKKASAPRQEKERQEPTRPAAVPVIVAIALIAGVLLLLYYKPWQLLTPEDDELSLYNYYNFTQGDDGLWYVRIQVNQGPNLWVAMHHHPTEVDRIPVEQDAVDVINDMANRVAAGESGELYIAMDPEGSGALVIAGVELARVFGEKFGIFNIPTSSAFSRQPPASTSAVPVRTCADADEDTAVVLIRVADEERVGVPVGYDNCIVIQSTTDNGTISVADRFVYALFNVIPAS